MTPVTLLSDGVSNILVLLGLTFVIRLTLPRLVRLPRRIFAPAVGVLFGAVGLGSLQSGPFIEGGIHGSLHNIVLVSSAVFGGPVAALVATAIVALFRIHQGGMLPVALIGMAGALALGLAFHRWVVVPRGSALRARDFLALGMALALVNVGLPFALTIIRPERFDRAVELAELILPVVLLIYPLGVLALCEFVRAELKRIEDAAALRRANVELGTRADALRASEERFRALIDNLPDIASLKDGDGHYLVVNRRFLQAHGIGVGDAVGRTVRDMAPPDEAELIAAMERQVRETGQPRRRETELTFSGNRLSVIVTKFPIASQSGGLLIGTVITDVTEFERLREQLHHAQKMETVGQLTGGIAHDFNNLLTVIIGNLELLMDHLHRSPPLLRFAETAHDGATRAAELTRRLLAFSRRQALRPVVFDLNALIANMLELLQRTLGAEIELRTELAEGLAPALADSAQVESVLLNLVINARDAMPTGGVLTIGTANVELDAEYAWSHDEVRPGAYVLLTVADSGAGMTRDTAARAFEPFFTTKEVGKGTGLGLSMVYGFVKQSGGHVELYSEVGMGTAVKVFLPRAGTAERRTQRRPAPQRKPAPRGKETILVVEDDPTVRGFVLEQLAALGYTVAKAASGPEALMRLDGDDVDLLFTDVVMPGGMSGFDLAKAATARRPGLRVLFTSGYAEEAMRQRGLLEPGTQLLSKPYPKSALAEAVRELLDLSDEAIAAARTER